jgi:hypothetical protein
MAAGGVDTAGRIPVAGVAVVAAAAVGGALGGAATVGAATVGAVTVGAAAGVAAVRAGGAGRSSLAVSPADAGAGVSLLMLNQ